LTIPTTEFELVSGALAELKCDVLILAVFEKRRLSTAAEQIDKASHNKLTALLEHGDMDGEKDQALLILDVPDLQAQRVLLVGCGKIEDFTPAIYLDVCGKAISQVCKPNIKHVVSALPLLEIDKQHDDSWNIVGAVTSAYYELYRFDETKSKNKDEATRSSQPALVSLACKNIDAKSTAALDQGKAIGRGVSFARELGNLPGNICTPTYLAHEAVLLAEKLPIDTTILEEEDMEKLGMGALLSVSRGSRQPAKLIIMEYKGAGNSDKPVVLVGKGLTFDAGGISLKQAATMDEMKFDMCGSACVFGVMQIAAELKLPLNVVGIIPSSENLPDGDANKPGDVVTSMSGQTIEILNTDAEGRLILCDALTYAAKFKPDTIIDIATLTGAVVVALGDKTSGLLGNDESLIKDLIASGEMTLDRAWQLPLWEEYQEQLDSNFADMANVGGPGAGTITAACFLSRYTKEYKWAHLDIAGTAWKKGKQKGATGRPVKLLAQYLIKKSASN